jgi:hypothetical protein
MVLYLEKKSARFYVCVRVCVYVGWGIQKHTQTHKVFFIIMLLVVYLPLIDASNRIKCMGVNLYVYGCFKDGAGGVTV